MNKNKFFKKAHKKVTSYHLMLSWDYYKVQGKVQGTDALLMKTAQFDFFGKIY